MNPPSLWGSSLTSGRDTAASEDNISLLTARCPQVSDDHRYFSRTRHWMWGQDPPGGQGWVSHKGLRAHLTISRAASRFPCRVNDITANISPRHTESYLPFCWSSCILVHLFTLLTNSCGPSDCSPRLPPHDTELQHEHERFRITTTHTHTGINMIISVFSRLADVNNVANSVGGSGRVTTCV